MSNLSFPTAGFTNLRPSWPTNGVYICVHLICLRAFSCDTSLLSLFFHYHHSCSIWFHSVCQIWVFSLNATYLEMHYFTTKITIYNINYLSIMESRDAPVEFSFMLLCLCIKWIYWILLKINVSRLNQCSQRRQCMC